MPKRFFQRKKTLDLIKQIKTDLVRQGVPEGKAEKEATNALKASVAISRPPKPEEQKQVLEELKRAKNDLEQSFRQVKSPLAKKAILEELSIVNEAIEAAQEKEVRTANQRLAEEVSKTSLDDWVKRVEKKKEKAVSSSAYDAEEKDFYRWYSEVVKEIAEAIRKKEKKE